jgi:hypothetical protein
MQSQIRLNQINQRTESFITLATEMEKVATVEIRKRVKEILVLKFNKKKIDPINLLSLAGNYVASLWSSSDIPAVKKVA